jgi:hypothetical protein
MKRKIYVGVDYRTDIEDESLTTFEIFDNITEAYEFANTLKLWQNRRYFIADFNRDDVFLEKDGQWNYDDNAGLYDFYTPIEL